MSQKLGIFLNNTNDESNFLINYRNYKNIRNNFDFIFIIDIDNKFAIKLKNKINLLLNKENEILMKQNKKNIENPIKIIAKENKIKFFTFESDDFIEKIIHLQNEIMDHDFENITFIQDHYIYVSNLENYFQHIQNSNYDFYCYTDSSELFYHLQLYIFTLKKNIFEKFINCCLNYFKNKKNYDPHSYILNFLKYVTEMFINRSVFVKVAYIDIIYDKNILLIDHNFYYELLENNILPVIDINLLNKYIKQYDNQKLTVKKIPSDFNTSIYKEYNDLKEMTEEDLKKHFLNHGQFECRKYKLNNYIQPFIIHKVLEKNNLLKYFDFPNNFDLYLYKKYNKDIKTFNKIQLKKHWFEFGFNEDRIMNEETYKKDLLIQEKNKSSE